MHFHIGVLEALKVFGIVVVVGFFWRLMAAMYSQTSWGQAMAFLY